MQHRLTGRLFARRTEGLPQTAGRAIATVRVVRAEGSPARPTTRRPSAARRSSRPFPGSGRQHYRPCRTQHPAENAWRHRQRPSGHGPELEPGDRGALEPLFDRASCDRGLPPADRATGHRMTMQTTSRATPPPYQATHRHARARRCQGLHRRHRRTNHRNHSPRRWADHARAPIRWRTGSRHSQRRVVTYGGRCRSTDGP